MKLYSFKASQRAPHSVFAPLSKYPYSLFFDSADNEHELGRYSFIVYEPIETIESRDGAVTVTNRSEQFILEQDPFAVVEARLDLYGLDKKKEPDFPPFQGGAAGFFGYDLARGLEKLPEQTSGNPDMPDMAIGIYDQVFAYDHKEDEGWYIVHAPDKETAQARYDHFQRLTEKEVNTDMALGGDSHWQVSHSREEYEESVQKVIDYIYAGDIFQANLSQRFEAALPDGFDPWAHYTTLRNVNAAPFASFMNFGAVKIASASPERFIEVRDRMVETRPIKGTRKRVDEEAIDQFYRNQLENSEKDRSENAMIVDLLRNDLSKSCEDHSLHVPQLCNLESFKKVHHLVSIVRGRLRVDKTPLDLLRGCFPGGSITGAPKVRAMEIIEELEQHKRGPYCGAMGYIGFDGSMDTNITIRTLVYADNKVSFNVGGGIVAGSKPHEEYDETLVKAEAIFNSFETAQNEAGDDMEEKISA